MPARRRLLAPSPAPRSRSLQARLLIWLLLPLAVVLPLRAWVQYEQTVGQTNDAFDEGLDAPALALADLVQWDDGVIRFALSAQTEHWLRADQSDTVYIAVLGPDRRTVAGDMQLASVALERPSAGVLIRWLRRLAALPHQPATDLRGVRFYDTRVRVGTQLQPVRLALKRVACGPVECEVRVAETLLKRERIEREALQGTVGFFLGLVAIEVLIIVLAVRMSFAPLRRLSDELAGRASDDLRPLPATDVPAELHPFIQATNGLFARVREASAAQQAFIADAAHQLRTPLTALKTQLGLLQRQVAQTPASAEMAPLVQAALRTTDDAVRLTAQLLALTRAEHGPDMEPRASVDLVALARQVTEDHLWRAHERGDDLGFESTTQKFEVQGHAVLLQEALANLIDNAMHHGGAGVCITVRVGAQGIEVEDDGPGIPLAHQAHVFERFYRAAPAGVSGSGLGLAIVQEIARQHGALAQVQSPVRDGRGTLMRLRWPQV